MMVLLESDLPLYVSGSSCNNAEDVRVTHAHPLTISASWQSFICAFVDAGMITGFNDAANG